MTTTGSVLLSRRPPHIWPGITFVLFLATLIGSGCSPWHVESNKGPFNGPNSTSPTFVRKHLQPEGMMEQEAWVSRHGGKVLIYSVGNAIDSYCAQLPDFTNRTELQAGMNNHQLRLAPAKFWIVSIEPTVVLMTPFLVANPDQHSLQELGGAVDEHALVSEILANRYNFSTNVEYAQSAKSIQWFIVGKSHELHTEQFNGDHLALTNGDMVLVLTRRAAGGIDVNRIAK